MLWGKGYVVETADGLEIGDWMPFVVSGFLNYSCLYPFIIAWDT